MLGRPFCTRRMGPSGFHTLSDITWSIVYNAVPEIRVAGSVSVEWFLAKNSKLLFTQGQVGVTETLRILLIIFRSMACIQNVRLFVVYDVRCPFLAEIHTAPLKRSVPSSVLQAVRALRNAPAALAMFLAGVAPVLVMTTRQANAKWPANFCNCWSVTFSFWLTAFSNSRLILPLSLGRMEHRSGMRRVMPTNSRTCVLSSATGTSTDLQKVRKKSKSPEHISSSWAMNRKSPRTCRQCWTFNCVSAMNCRSVLNRFNKAQDDPAHIGNVLA